MGWNDLAATRSAAAPAELPPNEGMALEAAAGTLGAAVGPPKVNDGMPAPDENPVDAAAEGAPVDTTGAPNSGADPGADPPAADAGAPKSG